MQSKGTLNPKIGLLFNIKNPHSHQLNQKVRVNQSNWRPLLHITCGNAKMSYLCIL